jgi:3-hydroxyisobutyrate dehydrogenase-like beta-hydroxyacid dehydrogenase
MPVENLEDRISAVRRFNRFFTRQIGAECQRVLVMVVNGAQVEAVVQGEHGLLQTMTRGTILVCSTIPLAELHRVAAQGVTVIDTPVSGGVEGAAEGTLTIFCGGDPASVEAHRPVLQVVGAHVAHLGPLGGGSGRQAGE